MIADQRRALEMLANSRGATETTLQAYGFAPEVIADLVRNGLATATTDRAPVSGGTIKVTKAGARHEGATPPIGDVRRNCREFL
jgi:hypothetical protein